MPDRKHHIVALYPEKGLSDVAQIAEIDEGGSSAYRESSPVTRLPHERSIKNGIGHSVLQ